MEFNRATPVGRTLIRALNSLLDQGRLSASQAREILHVFDEVFAAEIARIPEQRLPERQRRTSRLTGRLEGYQILHDNWRVDASETYLEAAGSRKRLRLGNTRLLFNEQR